MAVVAAADFLFLQPLKRLLCAHLLDTARNAMVGLARTWFINNGSFGASACDGRWW